MTGFTESNNYATAGIDLPAMREAHSSMYAGTPSEAFVLHLLTGCLLPYYNARPLVCRHCLCFACQCHWLGPSAASLVSSVAEELESMAVLVFFCPFMCCPDLPFSLGISSPIFPGTARFGVVPGGVMAEWHQY
jgi:hypothetical protein